MEDYYVIETNGLRLLKLGLIYGANASGKTTILKALNFLQTLVLNPKNQKTETFNFEPFLFDKNTPKENTVFEIEFIQNDTRYYYEIEMNTDAIVREELYTYNPKKSNVFCRTTDLENQVSKIKFGSKININEITKINFEQITLWNNTVLGGFLKINLVSKELKDAIDWFKTFLNPSIGTKTQLDSFITKKIEKSEINKGVILEILRKADFNISDILIKEEEKEIPKGLIEFFEKQISIPQKEVDELKENGKMTSVNLEFKHTIKDDSYSLSFKMESLGTQRYYGFAGILYLLIKSSTLFPIDELENSLHPDLYQHFLFSFLVNSKKSQIIATTHNREILGDKDVFRNDVIWVTDKDNESCATELYSFADFGTKVIRDTTNVLNAYKLGKLGGVPNLGDYYIDIESYERK
ncbi:abortive infection protein [Bacteroidia bacterium]|nr:abortive infection protein [Bacteroidia bacterium]